MMRPSAIMGNFLPIYFDFFSLSLSLSFFSFFCSILILLSSPAILSRVKWSQLVQKASDFFMISFLFPWRFGYPYEFTVFFSFVVWLG